MSAQKTIKSFVLHNYGNLISAGDPEFDEQTKTWVAEVKSDYPVFLQDDRTPDQKLLRFIPIRRIGTVRFNENLGLLRNESTPREQCVATVQALLEAWRNRAEKIVVRACADYFVSVPEFRHYFTPIDEIIGFLLEEQFMSDEDLMKNRSPEKQGKTDKYLKLLEGLNFIRRIDDGYESGEMFLLLHERYENENIAGFMEEEFRRAIISEVVRERYTALRDEFEISRLQPTIHIDSCIYRPSLEAERLIHFSTASISEYYKKIYGRINPLSLIHILRRLRTVGAIRREGNYWSGTDELLSNMLKLKNEMPVLSPPSGAH